MPDPKTIRPDERPEFTPDRNVEAAVEDTHPASDPVSTTVSQGARAVPAEEMLAGAGGGSQHHRPNDAVTLSHAFPDGEAAKLALETMVREGPVDRRCAEVRGGEDGGRGCTLVLHVPRADAERLRGLLAKQASSGPAPR